MGVRRNTPTQPTTRRLPTNRDGAPATPAAPDLDRGLGDLVDEDRRQRAIDERRRDDTRRAIDRDVATWRGLLLDLAEQDQSVVVEHLGGRLAGRIVGLGEDVTVIESRGDGVQCLVRADAIVSVSADPATRSPDIRGHRDRPSDLRLRDLLAGAAEDLRTAVVHVRGRDQVMGGVLRAVGEDVLAMTATRSSTVCTFVAIEHVVRVDLEP